MSSAQQTQLRTLAKSFAGLDLLLLYGSRARDDAQEGSDWDFGYIADATFDAAGLCARLVLALQTDRIDLVDLASAGSVLRVRAAADAIPIYEARAGIFADFWFHAVSFWLDMGPLIQAEQRRLVAETAK